MDDQSTLTELMKLLQGGGTAGLAVFGYLIYKEFKELRQQYTSANIRLRVRIVRMESWLETISNGKFKPLPEIEEDRDSNGR